MDDEANRGVPATVFVSDASVEAESIAQVLRANGYLVVDVPLSMLVARVAVQRPRVVLVDADADGALDAVGRMRELPDADAIDVVFLGKLGGVFSKPEDATAHEASGFFPRPVDVPALVAKVQQLSGREEPPSSRAAPPPAAPTPASPAIPSDAPTAGSLPPPSIPIPSSIGGAASRPPASLPPASMRQMEPSSSRPPAPRPSQASGPRLSQRPGSIEPGAPVSIDPKRAAAIATPLSTELEQLLAEAEQRVPVQGSIESVPPTPEEEIEAVLPAELLEALDAPLAEDDDDEPLHEQSHAASRAVTGSKVVTGTGAPGTSSGTGSRAHTSSVPRAPAAPAAPPATGDLSLTPAPHKTHGGTHAGTTSSSGVTGAGSDAGRAHAGSQPPPTAYSPAPQPQSLAQLPEPPPAASARASSRAPLPANLPSVLGPGDPARAIGRAIASRLTGALAFETPEATRRLVLREGDAVTVASSTEDESLLAYLGVRGELPRETVRRLAGKFPAFGRHAGAALVAHGYLRQDQLWPTLRAHAEWILGRVLQTKGGTLALEADPPGRLRTEPGVFGGSTGAEVFVEVLRRVIPQDEAIERLGGPGARFADGEHGSLVSECALSAAEVELVGGARGRSLEQVIASAPESDIATVLYAASLLGIVEALRGVGGSMRAAEPAPDRAEVDALDEEALRARVKARLQIVEEGDYFAVLGVARDATGYEVRRAFVELRRAFEPSRVLTPPTADLADDVRKIVTVLEEAYEILRDAARRERYRRAIAASPS